MIRPTARLIVVAAMGIPVAVLAVGSSEDLWIVAIAYLATVLLLTGLDLRLTLPASRLSVAAHAPGHLYVGDTGSCAFEIASQQPAAGLPLQALLDTGPNVETPAATSITLDAAGHARLEMPLRPIRRGKVELPRLWLRWQGRLGLTWITKIVTLGLEVPAIPDLGAVRRQAILLNRRGDIHGSKPQALHGDGSEFEALREYRPGLDVKSIDWKQSAKHRLLVCKEFHAERNHHIIVALDTGYLMREPLQGLPKIDRAINAALIVAWQALAEGDRVGLFAFDSTVRTWQAPRAGTASFQHFQRAAAALDYSHEETNFTLGLAGLSERLNRRALVVLITDFVDSVTAELMLENVNRLSQRHLVLFVALRDGALEAVQQQRPQSAHDIARSIAAADMLRERQVVLERLRRRGVATIDARPDELDGALLTRYLEIKQRELI